MTGRVSITQQHANVWMGDEVRSLQLSLFLLPEQISVQTWFHSAFDEVSRQRCKMYLEVVFFGKKRWITDPKSYTLH